jgi:hypothetical protein
MVKRVSVRGKALAVIPLVLFAASLAEVRADDIDLQAGIELLASSTMKVNMTARVLPYNDKPIWNSTKLTIPGRSLKFRLDGDNIHVYLICTPYIQEDGNILLLAQGQVWLSETPENEVKYSSSFYSVPLAWGEKVLFFPLGISQADIAKKVTKEDLDKKVFNLELEIQIVPYKGK